MGALPRIVVRTHLVHTGPPPPPLPVPPGTFARELVVCPVALYRELYAGVGAAWQWTDRLAWSDAQLAAHLANPRVRIRLLEHDGDRAGYAELFRHEDGRTEILYFGLLPASIGRGLGRWFLTDTLIAAWSGGTARVILNTCTDDHPAALPNYLARGFTIEREEAYAVP